MTLSLKRATSILTLIVFSVTNSVWALPSGAIDISPRGEMSTFLQVEIPSDLASVEEIYEAPARPDPKLILHIQNVHGHYEAQVQIKKLLDYLEKQYSFQLIFVEGASEKLNPDILKLFPDQKLNLELADYLAKMGELTGPEIYMMGGPEGVEAVGIEEPALYRQNYEAFKAVHLAKPSTDKFLSWAQQNLDRLSSRFFSEDGRRLLAEWKKFNEGRREFLPFAQGLSKDAKKILGLDLGSLFAQVEWPQLTRLLVLQQMEKDLDRVKAEGEKERVVEFLKSQNISKEVIEAIGKLGERRITMSRVGANGSSERLENLPRYLLERLAEEAGPKGFKFHDYPAFSLYAGYLILQSELDSKDLFTEIELLFEKILNELTPSEREKNLWELFRDAEILTRLLHLELSRKEWVRADYRREWLEPESLVRRILALEKNADGLSLSNPAVFEQQSAIRPLRETFDEALIFYQFAQKREDVFFEKIEKEMAERQMDKAVLVTGGFHTDGLSDKFREHEINYGVLMPRISQKIDNVNYLASMLENHTTAFDVANLEIINLMQSYESKLALGESPDEEFKTLFSAYMEIGNRHGIFADLEGAIGFLNRVAGENSTDVEFRVSPDGNSVLIKVQDSETDQYYQASTADGKTLTGLKHSTASAFNTGKSLSTSTPPSLRPRSELRENTSEELKKWFRNIRDHESEFLKLLMGKEIPSIDGWKPLTPRQREVLSLRFGLESGEELSDMDVAHRLKITSIQSRLSYGIQSAIGNFNRYKESRQTIIPAKKRLRDAVNWRATQDEVRRLSESAANSRRSEMRNEPSSPQDPLGDLFRQMASEYPQYREDERLDALWILDSYLTPDGKLKALIEIYPYLDLEIRKRIKSILFGQQNSDDEFYIEALKEWRRLERESDQGESPDSRSEMRGIWDGIKRSAWSSTLATVLMLPSANFGQSIPLTSAAAGLKGKEMPGSQIGLAAILNNPEAVSENEGFKRLMAESSNVFDVDGDGVYESTFAEALAIAHSPDANPYLADRIQRVLSFAAGMSRWFENVNLEQKTAEIHFRPERELPAEKELTEYFDGMHVALSYPEWTHLPLTYLETYQFPDTYSRAVDNLLWDDTGQVAAAWLRTWRENTIKVFDLDLNGTPDATPQEMRFWVTNIGLDPTVWRRVNHVMGLAQRISPWLEEVNGTAKTAVWRLNPERKSPPAKHPRVYAVEFLDGMNVILSMTRLTKDMLSETAIPQIGKPAIETRIRGTDTGLVLEGTVKDAAIRTVDLKAASQVTGPWWTLAEGIPIIDGKAKFEITLTGGEKLRTPVQFYLFEPATSPGAARSEVRGGYENLLRVLASAALLLPYSGIPEEFRPQIPNVVSVSTNKAGISRPVITGYPSPKNNFRMTISGPPEIVRYDILKPVLRGRWDGSQAIWSPEWGKGLRAVDVNIPAGPNGVTTWSDSHEISNPDPRNVNLNFYTAVGYTFFDPLRSTSPEVVNHPIYQRLLKNNTPIFSIPDALPPVTMTFAAAVASLTDRVTFNGYNGRQTINSWFNGISVSLGAADTPFDLNEFLGKAERATTNPEFKQLLEGTNKTYDLGNGDAGTFGEALGRVADSRVPAETRSKVMTVLRDLANSAARSEVRNREELKEGFRDIRDHHPDFLKALMQNNLRGVQGWKPLTLHQKKVLTLRFGLESGEELADAEVARRLGLQKIEGPLIRGILRTIGNFRRYNESRNTPPDLVRTRQNTANWLRTREHVRELSEGHRSELRLGFRDLFQSKASVTVLTRELDHQDDRNSWVLEVPAQEGKEISVKAGQYEYVFTVGEGRIFLTRSQASGDSVISENAVGGSYPFPENTWMLVRRGGAMGESILPRLLQERFKNAKTYYGLQHDLSLGAPHFAIRFNRSPGKDVYTVQIDHLTFSPNQYQTTTVKFNPPVSEVVEGKIFKYWLVKNFGRREIKPVSDQTLYDLRQGFLRRDIANTRQMAAELQKEFELRKEKLTSLTIPAFLKAYSDELNRKILTTPAAFPLALTALSNRGLELTPEQIQGFLARLNGIAGESRINAAYETVYAALQAAGSTQGKKDVLLAMAPVSYFMTKKSAPPAEVKSKMHDLGIDLEGYAIRSPTWRDRVNEAYRKLQASPTTVRSELRNLGSKTSPIYALTAAGLVLASAGAAQAAPEISNIKVRQNSVELTVLNVQPGSTITIESSRSLPGNFTGMAEAVAGPNGTVTITIPGDTTQISQRYFRAVESAAAIPKILHLENPAGLAAFNAAAAGLDNLLDKDGFPANQRRLSEPGDFIPWAMPADWGLAWLGESAKMMAKLRYDVSGIQDIQSAMNDLLKSFQLYEGILNQYGLRDVQGRNLGVVPFVVKKAGAGAVPEVRGGRILYGSYDSVVTSYVLLYLEDLFSGKVFPQLKNEALVQQIQKIKPASFERFFENGNLHHSVSVAASSPASINWNDIQYSDAVINRADNELNWIIQALIYHGILRGDFETQSVEDRRALGDTWWKKINTNTPVGLRAGNQVVFIYPGDGAAGGWTQAFWSLFANPQEVAVESFGQSLMNYEQIMAYQTLLNNFTAYGFGPSETERPGDYAQFGPFNRMTVVSPYIAALLSTTGTETGTENLNLFNEGVFKNGPFGRFGVFDSLNPEGVKAYSFNGFTNTVTTTLNQGVTLAAFVADLVRKVSQSMESYSYSADALNHPRFKLPGKVTFFDMLARIAPSFFTVNGAPQTGERLSVRTERGFKIAEVFYNVAGNDPGNEITGVAFKFTGTGYKLQENDIFELSLGKSTNWPTKISIKLKTTFGIILQEYTVTNVGDFRVIPLIIPSRIVGQNLLEITGEVIESDQANDAAKKGAVSVYDFIRFSGVTPTPALQAAGLQGERQPSTEPKIVKWESATNDNGETYQHPVVEVDAINPFDVQSLPRYHFSPTSEEVSPAPQEGIELRNANGNYRSEIRLGFDLNPDWEVDRLENARLAVALVAAKFAVPKDAYAEAVQIESLVRRMASTQLSAALSLAKERINLAFGVPSETPEEGYAVGLDIPQGGWDEVATRGIKSGLEPGTKSLFIVGRGIPKGLSDFLKERGITPRPLRTLNQPGVNLEGQLDNGQTLVPTVMTNGNNLPAMNKEFMAVISDLSSVNEPEVRETGIILPLRLAGRLARISAKNPNILKNASMTKAELLKALALLDPEFDVRSIIDITSRNGRSELRVNMAVVRAWVEHLGQKAAEQSA